MDYLPLKDNLLIFADYHEEKHAKSKTREDES